MLAQIEEFARLLRRGGLTISTPEIADAGRAVAAVGFSDPGLLRASLAAALVKRGADRDRFDELFDLFFLRAAPMSREGDLAALAEALAEEGLDPDAIARALEMLRRLAAELSAMGRALLGLRSLDGATEIRDAGLAAELAGIESPLQVGFYTYRIADALGLDAAEREALEALDAAFAGGLPGAATREGLRGIVRRNARALRAAVRDHVQGEFRRRHPDFRERLARDALVDRPLASLGPGEQDALETEVARLAAVLRARLARRRRDRRGGIDMRRTLRRSLATGGVPMELCRARRRRERPRLVVLCDVSDSVRNVSRFMLQLVYALQDLFSDVRSFAFVAELGELTQLFRQSKLSRALESAYRGDVVNVFANSNYGRALTMFRERHLGIVNRRTTVLIIGDGRNNDHPGRAEELAAIRRRARELLWLSPESPAMWCFGDSAMSEYQPYCDRVLVASDLRSLREAVDSLFQD